MQIRKKFSPTHKGLFAGQSIPLDIFSFLFIWTQFVQCRKTQANGQQQLNYWNIHSSKKRRTRYKVCLIIFNENINFSRVGWCILLLKILAQHLVYQRLPKKWSVVNWKRIKMEIGSSNMTHPLQTKILTIRKMKRYGIIHRKGHVFQLYQVMVNRTKSSRLST